MRWPESERDMLFRPGGAAKASARSWAVAGPEGKIDIANATAAAIAEKLRMKSPSSYCDAFSSMTWLLASAPRQGLAFSMSER
ncbi:hypothetical protein D3C87_1016460 [compost metagenome]